MYECTIDVTERTSKSMGNIWGAQTGGSRPSAKEGARLTMNVEFCEDNSGISNKMRYFRENKVPCICHWSRNRKVNPWGNTVMGSSEFGVIQGLSVSQDWVLVKVRLRATLGVGLERDEGTHGKRKGETHQCRGTH